MLLNQTIGGINSFEQLSGKEWRGARALNNRLFSKVTNRCLHVGSRLGFEPTKEIIGVVNAFAGEKPFEDFGALDGKKHSAQPSRIPSESAARIPRTSPSVGRE